MKISIRHFRRVERADIAGAPIILIGGNNDQGKSSIVMGTALAAVGWGLPLGMAKKNATEVILRGHDSAAVSLAVGDGMVRVTYPKLDIASDGVMRVSTVAAGLSSIARMQPDEVAVVLGALIGAAPTLDDILNEVADLNLPTDLAGKIWSVIKAKGWDGAARQAQENGVKLKGFWEQTTGQKRWGATVGASWRPVGWDDALAFEKIEDADLIERRQELQAARENAAVSGAEIERLTREAASLEADKQAVIAAEKAVAAADAELVKAEAAKKALPVPDDDSGDLPCPHCGGLLRLERIDSGVTKIVAAEAKVAISADALKKMRSAQARADGEIANLRSQLGSARTAEINAKVAVERSATGAKALDVANAKQGTADVAALAAALTELERKAGLVHQAKEGARFHGLIVQNIALQGLLAAEGLRHKVLVRSLERFNTEHLAPICADAGWKPVVIDPDMTVRFGEIRWSGLGQSARWIAECVVQVAIARLDGSQLVVMDGADVLDAKNRNRLFGMLLKQSGFETLIGMTFNRPDQMPALGDNGACYWVEDGNARML